jgi:hypothetical protein
MRPPSPRSLPPLSLSVPLSRFTPRLGGGQAFYVMHTRVMRFFALLILLVVVCAGCQTQPTEPSAAQQRGRLKTITLVDGISQSEAQIIGECYFAKNVGCGAFHGVHDGGDRWIVDAAFGYAAVPVKGFYIDKQSGRVVSPIGPSYDNPLEIYP